MTTRFRKMALTAHILFSVGWFGAVAAFLALAIAGLTGHDVQMVRTAYTAMELTARYVIVLMALASLLSGIIQSLGTPWGLFRHYWVLVKLLLTSFATAILLVKMPLIMSAARQSQTTPPFGGDLHLKGMQLAVHAFGGLIVLLLITALSVYKPWGLTGYGRRKQHERQSQSMRSALVSCEETVRWPNADKTGDGFSRRFKFSLAAVAVVVAVGHLSLFLTGHSFHHLR